MQFEDIHGFIFGDESFNLMDNEATINLQRFHDPSKACIQVQIVGQNCKIHYPNILMYFFR